MNLRHVLILTKRLPDKTIADARERLMLNILLPFLFLWKSEDAQSNT